MGLVKASGHKHRILVVTPSHALAEETAQSWEEAGAEVAVNRGYEGKDPSTGTAMCRDVPLVKAAILARRDIHRNVCKGSGGARCPFFAGCLKQANRSAVADAEVVVAPYDVLFTALQSLKGTLGAILVDEGCWQRAITTSAELTIAGLASEHLSGVGARKTGVSRPGPTADLAALREQLRSALADQPNGIVLADRLRQSGITAELCSEGRNLEEQRLRKIALLPGLDGDRRLAVLANSAHNKSVEHMLTLWAALETLMEPDAPNPPAFRLDGPGRGEARRITIRQRKDLHSSLSCLPMLHLDATLRPELAGAVLPLDEIIAIDATAPHLHVRQIVGSFGKTTICPKDGLPADEANRRENRLGEIIDHVRWEAMRMAARRTLVVTHKEIESAFAEIPGVEVAHFNAIAGLDCYKDVGLIISIGRPLPPSQEAEGLAAAYFGTDARGAYEINRTGVHMRDGTIASISVRRHSQPQAEVLRAAICDDELIQVVGRGRGVNRSAANPLEVQIFADVGLPLVHDSIEPFETLRPDPLQRMLLDGIATDSPTDAAAMHPQLYGNAEQVKKAFARSGVFKGHFPIDSTYRGLSLKSALYRRGGRGRRWQTVWWVKGDEFTVRETLEQKLGSLAGWRPASCA